MKCLPIVSVLLESFSAGFTNVSWQFCLHRHCAQLCFGLRRMAGPSQEDSTAYNDLTSVHNEKSTAYNELATAHNKRSTAYKEKSTFYNTTCTSYNEKATKYNGLGTEYNEKITAYNDVTTAYNKKTTINNENKYHKAGMAFHRRQYNRKAHSVTYLRQTRHEKPIHRHIST